ncbi:hypothetical protein LIER_08561 [Lithospermum erythrorhizon]|uniref:F-box domain-containing protein n=1 Tax=Lithospermum erythrorhizon TaxID=34254 RepID=A0AAV3PH50_LITER
MVVIPNDVVTDILSRLPVKPLLRFRCVRKSWRDLVDSRKFIKLHLNKTRESNFHRKLILQDTSGLYSADFNKIVANNVVVPFVNATRICCCNGLLCMKSCMKLPSLGLDRTPIARFPVAEVDLISGFGYDVDADDYKLMVLLKIENQLGELLYSLKSNSWREIMPFPYYLKSDEYPGV